MCVANGCRDTLRNILMSIYGNKESVDEQLIEVLIISYRHNPQIVLLPLSKGYS